MLDACATTSDALLTQPPKLTPATPTAVALEDLPPPPKPLYVAVYSFRDETGQNKPNDSFPEYSRAVTQGGAAILINALKEAGEGKWFIVLERENLDALLQERQLIRSNRDHFLGEDGKPLPPIRGLYNAALIIGGGIIGYDSNVVTGGAGARYLGIGSDVKYRRDQVTVNVRITAVKTGEILVSTVVDKTVYSVAVHADAYRYVAINKLLEAEAGVTRNEPAEWAVESAIEKAVRLSVLQGVLKGYWHFADASASRRLLTNYLAEKAAADYPTPSLDSLVANGPELSAPPPPAPQTPTNPSPAPHMAPVPNPEPAQTKTPAN